MSDQVVNSVASSQRELEPAFYVFNEKLSVFVDSIEFLGKFSETLQVEFGEGTIFIEAVTATKSACASIQFDGLAIAEWSYGGLEVVPDKRVLLPSKQIIGALKNITKHDTMTLYFCGIHCESAIIQYPNIRDVLRTYTITARDIPMLYSKRDYSRRLYANHIMATTTFFKNVFSQMNDSDELCLKFYPDLLEVTKFFTHSTVEAVAMIESSFEATSFEVYEVTVPMSLTVSVRELRVALNLITIYSHLAHVYFDTGEKPLLVTYDDEETDLKCRILLAVADAREFNDENDPEIQKRTRSQNGTTQDQSVQNGDEIVAAEPVGKQQQERVVERQQKKKSKGFSFEGRDTEPSQHQDLNAVQISNAATHNQDQNDVQMSNAYNQHQDFNDVHSPVAHFNDMQMPNALEQNQNLNAIQMSNAAGHNQYLGDVQMANGHDQHENFNDVQVHLEQRQHLNVFPISNDAEQHHNINNVQMSQLEKQQERIVERQQKRKSKGFTFEDSDTEAGEHQDLNAVQVPSAADHNQGRGDVHMSNTYNQHQDFDDVHTPPAPDEHVNNVQNQNITALQISNAADHNQELVEVQMANVHDQHEVPLGQHQNAMDVQIPNAMEQQNDMNESQMNFYHHPYLNEVLAPSVPGARPPPIQRNQTANPCLEALRLLGVEDQISDLDEPDVIETYDLPTSDPSKIIISPSQINRLRR